MRIVEKAQKMPPLVAERELMRLMRRLTTIRAQRRSLVKRLKELDGEARTLKRELKGLMQDVSGSNPDDPTPIRDPGQSDG